jgi:hypothetical protein
MFGFDKEKSPMATKLIDLTKLNMETLEVLFASENPSPKERGKEKADGTQKTEDKFEIARKLFFGN